MYITFFKKVFQFFLKITSNVVNTELKPVQYLCFSEVAFKKRFQTGGWVVCAHVRVRVCVCMRVCSLKAHCCVVAFLTKMHVCVSLCVFEISENTVFRPY